MAFIGGLSGATYIGNPPTVAVPPVGGGTDKTFYQNDQTVDADYTITDGQNAMSAGPITVSSGVTVTVGTGETWTVV